MEWFCQASRICRLMVCSGLVKLLTNIPIFFCRASPSARGSNGLGPGKHISIIVINEIRKDTKNEQADIRYSFEVLKLMDFIY